VSNRLARPPSTSEAGLRSLSVASLHIKRCVLETLIYRSSAIFADMLGTAPYRLRSDAS
jgi:hypothetical protein